MTCMIRRAEVAMNELRAVARRTGSLACATMAIVLVLAACGAAPATSHDAPAQVADAAAVAENRTSPRYSVCGIDRTGSYNFVEPGLDLCARLVVDARPGDVIVLRWISHASYLNDDFVARIQIPHLSLLQCSNAFDQRCKRQRAAQEAQLAAVKRAEVQRILQLRPTIVYRTDIYGFIQASAETLLEAPDGAERHLYAATDLLDNVRFRVSPDLQGVKVTILAFQTETDPARTLRLRRNWEEFFRKHGAETVSFHTAEVSP